MRFRRKIMQLEIEEAALKKETDQSQSGSSGGLQKELAELREQFNTERQHGTTRSRMWRSCQKLREEIEDVNKQIQVAQQEYDLEKAAELQYGRLPQLKKQLEQRKSRSGEDRTVSGS